MFRAVLVKSGRVAVTDVVPGHQVAVVAKVIDHFGFAALSILSFVLFMDKYLPERPNYFYIFFAVYSLIVAYLMISNVKYRTVKNINSKHSLLALFILASIIGSSILFPKEAIPAITIFYLISPILFAIFSKKKKRETETDEVVDK